MMRPDANVAVFVCVTPVDMRKQAATLALIVEQTLKRNIFEPALYVFSNERRDRIKIVYWQRNGLCLWSKRLEGRDRFLFPRQIEGETVTIRGAQLEELLEGFDVWRQGHRVSNISECDAFRSESHIDKSRCLMCAGPCNFRRFRVAEVGH
jgi:transposase